MPRRGRRPGPDAASQIALAMTIMNGLAFPAAIRLSMIRPACP